MLVTGGCNDILCVGGNSAGLTSSELYDPALGTWSSSGSLKNPRMAHRATVLGGPACSGATPPGYCGKVLISGGMSSLNAVTSAELFDPLETTNSKKFSLTGAMATGRVAHVSSSLAGPACSGGTPPSYCGKVLVAGGGGYTGAATATAELYDPATATWSATGSMAYGRYNHSGAVLTDGTILVSGSPQAIPGGDIAERYDPASGTWGSAGGMHAATDEGNAGIGTGCCAVTLASGPSSACAANCGKVLVLEGGPSPRVELYTPLPRVTSVTPTSASGAAMTTVTVNGTGLTAANRVAINGAGLVNVVPDPTTPDTKLTALATGGVSAGTFDLNVASPGGVSPNVAGDHFTFADWGLLRATTSPAVASQISLDGSYTTNWADTYGTTYLKQTPGTHTVCFRDKEGFTTPACQPVSVTAGSTASPVGNFVPRASCT